MRVKKEVCICLLTILSSLGVFAQNLNDFISTEDFHKLEMVLSSEPVFNEVNDVPMINETNPQVVATIPSVHQNPFDINIGVIDSPIFTEEHIIIPEINESVSVNDDEVETQVNFENSTHSNEQVNVILTTEPSFQENEDVPLRINEVVPTMSTDVKNTGEFLNNEHINVDEIISVSPIFDENENIEERVSEEVPALNNLDDIIHIDDVVVVDANDSEDFIVETFVPTEDVEVVEVQEVIPSITTDDNEWESNITDLGNSWYTVDWFGHFFSQHNPKAFVDGGWIYHVHLGWLFISSESFDSVWIWSDNFKEWIWTSQEAYPYASMHSNSNLPTWLYFDLDRNLVYDYEAEKYFDIN